MSGSRTSLATGEAARALLRERRRLLRLNQEAVAGAVGIDRTTLSLLEHGGGSLTVERFVGLCRTLGLGPARTLETALSGPPESGHPPATAGAQQREEL